MPMERSRNEGNIMQRAQRLYQASLDGDIPALLILIHEDPLILHRAPNIFEDELPLHIAAIRGDVGFTRAILEKAPHLAREKDSLGCTPLHWASTLGHLEVVRELLKTGIYKDVCLVRDHQGRNPLHLATIKGTTKEILLDLYHANPKAARECMNGDTVFHLCVKHHNSLDVLKLLVGLISKDMEFIFSKDSEGNTILHLAAFFKQLETIKYIISLDNKKKFPNIMNGHGLTALDVINYFPKDIKGIEIRDFLVQAGIQRAKDIKRQFGTASSSLVEVTTQDPTTNFNGDLTAAPVHCKTSMGKIRIYIGKIWKVYLENNSEWLETACGNLMVVATLIAAAAFQAGINPPGGVWQDAKYANVHNFTHVAGTSISGDVDQIDYNSFMMYNTISFVGSLAIILLVISGFPLKNKLAMLLLVIGVTVAVVSMLLSYFTSTCMLQAYNGRDDSCRTVGFGSVAYGTILILVILILVFHSIGCLLWLVVKFKSGVKAIKKMGA